MHRIERNRPRFSEKEAIALVSRMYEVAAESAEPLPSYQDQNFLIREAEGTSYVLKIANALEPHEMLSFQNRVMNHLSRNGSDDRFPSVLFTIGGEQSVQIAGTNGNTHLVRLVSYVVGRSLASVNPHTPALFRNLGRFLAEMDVTLSELDVRCPDRELPWDVGRVTGLLTRYADQVASPDHRALLDDCLALIESRLVPRFPVLRRSPVHHDANDHNVIVTDDGKHIAGIIDFGDMLHTFTIQELAIALAYTMLDKADPLSLGVHLVSGYHEILPLTPLELESLYWLVVARLCTSVALSAYGQTHAPENEYLSVSEQGAWRLLRQLAELGPELVHYAFRNACGREPCPDNAIVTNWLIKNQKRIGPILTEDLEKATVLDLSVGSRLLPRLDMLRDVDWFSDHLRSHVQKAGASVGIGRYDEARLVYRGEAFRTTGNEGDEWRTLHLGIDIYAAPGTTVLAPLAGRVHSFQDNDAPLDYGPTLILEHDLGAGQFYTLYGHLSADSLKDLHRGKRFEKSQLLAKIGDSDVNGGWPPHLHFQIVCDLMGRTGEFPGVARYDERDIWLSICPDPNLVLRMPAEIFPDRPQSRDTILAKRDRLLGPSLSLAFRKPLHIVRGWGQYLYDDSGRQYLDAVNNVCHVGHSHPRVVKSLGAQASVLNTNTRYLHEKLVEYSNRLCDTLPDSLSVCYFVCSGSEANELALRLARTHTGQNDFIVVEGAYHGNSSALIEISPYKYAGPGGSGRPAHVQEVPMPDVYRGLYRGNGSDLGRKYAEHVGEAIEHIRADGNGVAGFICESLLGCGGQIVLPEGYLRVAYRLVRAAGGVCIADEVQVGFGRVGEHFWGFQAQGVIPDIVTMGKPIGNGHPLAAVVTTREIADSFANGMEYFNTYGGNPVSCAVGLAVLDVIRDEKLQEKALVVGQYLKAQLLALIDGHQVIGDVRGLGLFLGIELVLDRGSKQPAAAVASHVAERMRDHGVLISIDGPDHNVLKIKPPMVFSRRDADLLVGTMDKVMAEDPVRRQLSQ